MQRPNDSALRARSPSPFKPKLSRQRTVPSHGPYTPASYLHPDALVPRAAERLSAPPPLDSDDDVDLPRKTNGDAPPPYRDAASEKSVDLEALKLRARNQARPSAAAAEYMVAPRTKFLYLAVWFTLNLSLTIYNKAVLGGFHFPWLLTAVHASFVTLGCYVLLLLGHFRLTQLGRTENMALVAFSFLFTINIAISNVSLAAVSVPFHQIMRSTCPIFAVLIYRIFYGRSYSTATYLSIIPIISGVALATYGDLYFTLTGFLLTLLGVFLAAVKTVVTNRLMTGSLALPALELLLRMSPLAALQALAYAHLSGETTRFVAFARAGNLPASMVLALLGNGLLAYVLNVSSFQTNRLAGALTLTVAGNLKQCLTVLLGIALFRVRVTAPNGLGMLVTVAGAAWYSKVELAQARRRGGGAAADAEKH